MENGYPLKFINRWKDRGIVRPTIVLAQKSLSTSSYRLEVSQIAEMENNSLMSLNSVFS